MLAQGEFVLQLLIMAVFGGICAAIANSRGRNAVGWFIIGMVAPCLGLILVLVLPNLKIEEERQARLRKENRRLRERLRKDRMVSDQRHHATMERLDVHDEALGVDTGRAHTAIPEGNPAPAPPPRLDDPTEWYYLEGENRIGPVGVAEMRDLWRQQRIGAETLVWSQTMTDWAALRTVTNLRRALDG
ncbi:MAG: DUF4339 domain-containing protein [Planctomycetota bacterium]|jgi:hypothetical protein